MNIFFGDTDSRRLAKAYIALVFAQDVAKGYAKEDASLHPVLAALEMSAKLLEEVLEDVLPEEGTENTDHIELLM